MGATSTSPSGPLRRGPFFWHSDPNVTDNGAARGYALFADIPKMSVRGRGKAAGPYLAALLCMIVISKRTGREAVSAALSNEGGLFAFN
jgi:hypothetical protein